MEGFAVDVFGPDQRLQRSRVLPPHPPTRHGRERGDPACLPGHKAALTMLTVQYARSLVGILVNAADPGYTGTDFNDHRGAQTVAEGQTQSSTWQPCPQTGRPVPSRTATARSLVEVEQTVLAPDTSPQPPRAGAPRSRPSLSTPALLVAALSRAANARTGTPG